MIISTKPKTSAMFQWFGSNRMLAEAAGEELHGLDWVGVVFAGGMSEVAHIDARTIIVNDLHRHAINCAIVVADPRLRPQLMKHLKRLPFAPQVLEQAQARCRRRQATLESDGSLFSGASDATLFDPLQWAIDYFVCVWMGRGGKAGTDAEFSGGISFRYDAGGGDSSTRFRSATRSLAAWGRIIGRDGVNFTSIDCFDFLANCKDAKGHGVYSDAPWPDAGDAYRHKFDDQKQRKLAKDLARFEKARVVVRFGDHSLIRELYPREKWFWRELQGRNQANSESREVLIINQPSYATVAKTA